MAVGGEVVNEIGNSGYLFRTSAVLKTIRLLDYQGTLRLEILRSEFLNGVLKSARRESACYGRLLYLKSHCCQFAFSFLPLHNQKTIPHST